MESSPLPSNNPAGSAPREVEIKLAVPDAGAAREMLLRAGFAEVEPRAFEANEVYDTPTFELRRAACLLRLREFGGRSILTYKGPPEPGIHRRRMELETEVGDASALRAILSELGYEVMFRYEKFRATFARSGEPGHALIDETPIGVYLELEGPPDWIDSTAAVLGFGAGAYIRESYGTLYRMWCERNGVPPPPLVFPHPAR
jgi:adenylate cyclase class 2